MKRLVSILLVIVLLTGTAYAINAVSVSYPILVNGTAMTFDVQPVNVNGRTLLPLRAISEALGVPITWNQTKGQVEIQTIDTEALKNSCVMLYVGKDGEYTEQGSGVLIDYDEILTCWHVVDDGANTFKAFYDDGTTQLASLTDSAASEDAATLKPSSTNVKPVKIGDSDSVKVGDTVYVVSSPNGSKNNVMMGKVTQTGTFENVAVFSTSADTNAGASGGACFNAQGELIGIVKGGSDTEPNSYVIPINAIRQSLAS